MTYEQWKADPKRISALLERWQPPEGTKAAHPDFTYYGNTFARVFTQVRTAYAFKKELLESMAATPFDQDIYWIAPCATPLSLGGTIAPIVHQTVDNATDRFWLLVALRKNYVELRKRDDIWLAIVNSRNTRNMTTLDYLDYLQRHDKFIPAQREAVQRLRAFLIENGAVHFHNEL